MKGGNTHSAIDDGNVKTNWRAAGSETLYRTLGQYAPGDDDDDVSECNAIMSTVNQ